MVCSHGKEGFIQFRNFGDKGERSTFCDFVRTFFINIPKLCVQFEISVILIVAAVRLKKL